MAEYDIITPVKAIFQGNGDVLLAEFVSTDFVGISNGGTGAATAPGARTNLELIKYETHTNYIDMLSVVPTETTLTKLDDSGDFYYSHDGDWRVLGGAILVSGFNALNEATDENHVSSLTFNDEFDLVDNDDGAIGVVLDLTPIRDRLDVIEGDETVPGSIMNAVYNLIDLAPTTLDTLNELAAAVGDDPDFINTINNKIDAVQDLLDAETLARIAADNSLETFFTAELAAETLARTTADSDQYTLITAETNAKLSTETTARTTEIAIINSSLTTFINQQNLVNTDYDLRLDIIEGDETTVGSIQYAINAVVGDAVAELDTLQELAEALANDPDILTSINTQINNLTIGDLLDVTINYPLNTGDIIAYDLTSGQFETKQQINGSFLKLIESDGSIDGIPVVRTTRGEVVLDSYVDFYQADGTYLKLNMQT